MTFNSLGIIDPILRALEVKGYTKPTPIQEQSIPILLEGKDLLGCAQTGTGKTAAFAIPIIQQLCEAQLDGPYVIKTLVVAPTRELAIQINDSFRDYAKFTDLRTTVIFGGVKQGKQVEVLQKGVDILVATPGRLLDLMNQGYISLRDVEFVVLDEADHMLDMGFIHDIKKIVAKLPEKRQSLFFSATMPPAILDLSSKILGRPERVTIKPQQATAEKVEQAVYFVAKKQKRKLLLHLIQEEKMDSVLVFSRTKHGANRIVKDLIKDGIGAAAIHGNKSQTARQKALKEFRQGKVQVLVATDIAARGIDVDELAFVINFDLPNVAETYVHRIGRTGRAQASGIAISFCDQEERAYLRDIQRLIKQDVPVVTDHPYVDDGTEVSPPSSNNQRSRGNGGNNNRRRGQGNGYSGGGRSGGSRSGGGNRRRSSSSRQHS
ncbi:DEAD/DEAH box helicase [Lewinella cohaerens]|uniref:DEAD/DEAH box helicase n=1 Tax=Lewinella cohaerens TaxID=70995 RepID=UPI00036F1AD3|nr:DEAD/DEAH box helicase [Lewinella cohaerens]